MARSRTSPRNRCQKSLLAERRLPTREVIIMAADIKHREALLLPRPEGPVSIPAAAAADITVAITRPTHRFPAS